MNLTNRQIRVMHAGLSALSSRTLPSLKSDLKISKLLREHFVPPYEATEDLVNKIRAKYPIPSTHMGGGIPASVQEARYAEMDEMLKLNQDIKDIPEKLYISDEDLPTSGEGRAGLADILVSLDFLYKEKEA